MVNTIPTSLTYTHIRVTKFCKAPNLPISPKHRVGEYNLGEDQAEGTKVRMDGKLQSLHVDKVWFSFVLKDCGASSVVLNPDLHPYARTLSELGRCSARLGAVERRGCG